MLSKSDEIVDVKYKDYIGKILFIGSLFLLLWMIFSPLNNVIVQVDEFFSFGLIKFSFPDLITITSADVHPPLYYIILKFFVEMSYLLNLHFDAFFISKIVSILPYGLIMIVSVLKLRKEYGWLAIGVFLFALATMSKFFVHFHLIRMYSWGLFFTLMSYIYLSDIIKSSDIKSWVLFTIFNVLGIFTQYYLALSSLTMYLCLFVYIFCFKQKSEFKIEFKKFIGSIVLSIILFSPWLLTFLSQLDNTATSLYDPVNIELIFNSFTYFICATDLVLLKIIAVISLIFFVLLAFKFYDNDPTDENFAIFSGVIIFIGTVSISIIISVLFKPIIVVRYFIPVSSVMWLSISLVIGKIKSNKLLIISLVLILILGISGMGNIFLETSKLCVDSDKQTDILNEINNDENGIIIINHTVALWQYASFLNHTKIYVPEDDYAMGVSMSNIHELYNFEEKTPNEIMKIITNHNNNTHVYFMDFWGNFKLNNDTNVTKLGRVGGNYIYQIN